MLATHDDIDRLYRDYGAAVSRWANHLTRSRADAEDVAQEAFLVAHRRRSDLAALRNPGAWLFRIVENVARHVWRRRRRCRAFSAGAAAGALGESIGANPTPLDLLELRRLMAQLDRALSTLCERDRRLLLMPAERHPRAAPPTARAGASARTLRVQRHRARLKIARCLRALEIVHEC